MNQSMMQMSTNQSNLSAKMIDPTNTHTHTHIYVVFIFTIFGPCKCTFTTRIVEMQNWMDLALFFPNIYYRCQRSEKEKLRKIDRIFNGLHDRARIDTILLRYRMFFLASQLKYFTKIGYIIALFILCRNCKQK